MNAATSTVAAPHRHRWRLVFGAAVGLGAIVAVVSAAGGVADAAEAVWRLDPSWLAVGVVASTLRIVAYAAQVWMLDRRRRTVGTSVGVALTVYGLGAVTPAAPAEGLVLAERALRRRGRSSEDALLVLGFSEWFAQRTFYVVAIVALLWTLALGHVTVREVWPLLVVAGVVAALLIVTARLASHPGRGRRTHAAIARILRLTARRSVDSDDVTTWHTQALEFVGRPNRRVRLAALSALAAVADGGVLWATARAAGIDLPYPLLLLCAAGATVITWIPLLPAGLGLVEAALPTLLHRFDVPLDDALAASLTYRAAGTLLPALIGAGAVVALRMVPRA